MPTATTATTAQSNDTCNYCGNRRPCPNRVYGSRYCNDCFSTQFIECAECHMQNLRQRSHDSDAGLVCAECHRRGACWDAGVFVSSGLMSKTKTLRRFGLELETSTCPHYRGRRGDTVWGVKFDCSVRGMEFVSPILQGDDGLECVKEFCDRSEADGYTADSDCGMHLHIDMRDATLDELKSVAYAYLKADAVWRTLVNNFRANDCQYCTQPVFNRARLEREGDAEDFADFCDSSNRYSAINLQAYTKFGSYEIRSHQGTVNATETCNWVKAHLRFVEWAKDKTFDEIEDAFRGSAAAKWETLKSILGDIELNRYYGHVRRERLGTNRQAVSV